jgi:hypothetical protein
MTICRTERYFCLHQLHACAKLGPRAPAMHAPYDPTWILPFGADLPFCADSNSAAVCTVFCAGLFQEGSLPLFLALAPATLCLAIDQKVFVKAVLFGVRPYHIALLKCGIRPKSLSQSVPSTPISHGLDQESGAQGEGQADAWVPQQGRRADGI